MALATSVILFWARPSWLSLGIGISLSAAGELLRLWALGWTGEHTRKQSLETPYLTVNGPYRFVRNPLYLGNILTSLGVIAASCGHLSAAASLGVFVFGTAALYFVYASCIISEEAFLAVKFGNIFFDYRASVPMIIPDFKAAAEAMAGLGGSNCEAGDPRAHFSFKEAEETAPQSEDAEPRFRRVNLKFETSSLFWLLLIWSYLTFAVLCR